MTTITTPEAVGTLAAAHKRRDWLKLISIFLATIGLLITGYLTYAKLTSTETVCAQNATFNCELVQTSYYSQLAGIPVAYIGLFGYVAILAALLLEGRVAFLTQRGPLIVFGMTLFGFLFSGYLTSIEAFVLHAWCMWCLGSAITMTLLFIVSAARAWRQFSLIEDEDAESAT